jgi:predicted RND superfamily exporter protein
MASSSVRLTSLRIGDFVIRFRAIIGAILLGISAVAIFYCSKVTIRTNFDDFFPSYHPDVQLYEKWHRYGGAQTLSVMIRVRQGDIFNYDTLSKIQRIQREVDRLPGVDHNEVLSIASYRVSFSETTPGSLTIKPFMFPEVPKTKDGIDTLRRNVMANRANITQ